MQRDRDCFFCKLPVYPHHLEGFPRKLFEKVFHFNCLYWTTIFPKETDGWNEHWYFNRPINGNPLRDKKKFKRLTYKCYPRANKEKMQEYHRRIKYKNGNVHSYYKVENFEHFQYASIIHPEYSGIMIPPSIIELIRDYTFEGCN
mgnify:CR=1 FL=1